MAPSNSSSPRLVLKARARNASGSRLSRAHRVVVFPDAWVSPVATR